MSYVIDELDRLFELQADKTPPSNDCPPEPDLPTVRLALYKPGTQVSYQGQWCTVHYVTLRRNQLLVQLHEITGAVDSSKLYVEPSNLTLRRN